MKLDWTLIALEDYNDCIEYVEKKFSEKDVFKFIQKMDHTLGLIASNPYTFPQSDYRDVRFVVVIKPITIFYTIPDQKTVQIIRIWNNRKEKNETKIKK